MSSMQEIIYRRSQSGCIWSKCIIQNFTQESYPPIGGRIHKMNRLGGTFSQRLLFCCFRILVKFLVSPTGLQRISASQRFCIPYLLPLILLDLPSLNFAPQILYSAPGRFVHTITGEEGFLQDAMPLSLFQFLLCHSPQKKCLMPLFFIFLSPATNWATTYGVWKGRLGGWEETDNRPAAERARRRGSVLVPCYLHPVVQCSSTVAVFPAIELQSKFSVPIRTPGLAIVNIVRNKVECPPGFL